MEEGEEGISGVKIASDSGIYAITDEDGKYHFPYIEVGRRLLKIDESTLPEGSVITTDSPYHITVTKGVLTKVSFGVKLPASDEELSPLASSSALQASEDASSGKQADKDEPLLKVSVSQDPVMLKPRLSIKAAIAKDKQNDNIDVLNFDITCNYYLFIEKSELVIYDKNYKPVKIIELPKPVPSLYKAPLKDLNLVPGTYYYQLTVYDKSGKKDRTGIGTIELKP